MPYTLRGHDIVGKAQTGTGKTAAFLTTIITELLNNPVEDDYFAGEARSLIIAPTRELVMQIAGDARDLCKYTNLKVHSLVGGIDYDKQKRYLHDSLCDILVATPGRLLDFASSSDVYLDRTEILVLDEADRMLDMGFTPQIELILKFIPKNHQTLLFSATLPDNILKISDKYLNKPERISVGSLSTPIEKIKQEVIRVKDGDKYNQLIKEIYNRHGSILIFVKTRRNAEKMVKRLKYDDHLSLIHI